ncbi:hypothetical protein SLEP1_g55543 [Rubroshorea leprosula]|uniref:DUF4219 domain-containing protein n=1 Tax=Rubroshorea leprosula TaxID=152421 RepID=A0AAV5MI72_9ROSI|nr:hypothetical protein SLEP1_g55543 [Rubroshorea leprosula]
MDANSVQPIPSTNAAVTLSASISEVLREDNYERWSILMQHYFVAQGLWDVVLSSQIPWNEDSRDWIKKNASALLAIKNSCGAQTFDQIKNMNLAKDAWNALADLHKPPNVDEGRGSGTDAGIMDNNKSKRTKFARLLKKIYRGDWNALKSLDKITEIIFCGGFTVLHIATISGRLEIVNELEWLKAAVGNSFFNSGHKFLDGKFLKAWKGDAWCTYDCGGAHCWINQF